MEKVSAIKLENLADFMVGNARCRPLLRRIECGALQITVEPRMMQVLALLSEYEGEVVSRREFFTRCWNDVPVGDDSLNRVIAGLRKVAEKLGERAFRIETVPGYGYVLYSNTRTACPVEAEQRRRAIAMAAGWSAWRRGTSTAPDAEIEALRKLCEQHPDDAEAHAMLAFLLRLGAESAEAYRCAALVLECEEAAAAALQIDPENDVALTALATVAPIYGDWSTRRLALTRILERRPQSIMARHELAILEMATGRIAAACDLVSELLEEDPRAPVLLYKRIEHLWAAGRFDEMDRVADNALQLWPQHPAIATARFWSLLATGRADQATHFWADYIEALATPGEEFAIFMSTARALGKNGNGEVLREAVAANVAEAGKGPRQAIIAIIHLALMGAVDDAFAVAEGYYCRRGAISVSLNPTLDSLSTADQSRRGGRCLFHPATQILREDPRFDTLVETIGLGEYWRTQGLTPDYRQRLGTVSALPAMPDAEPRDIRPNA